MLSHSELSPQARYELAKVALGEMAADLAILHGDVVNVYTAELLRDQTLLIKNGRIFDYILDRSNRFRGDTEITYRALGGMKEDGTIVFIVSDNSGGIDLRDLSLIARNFGVSQAIMFDGGSSLQYSLRYNGYSRDFRAFWKKVPIFIGVSPRISDKAALITNSQG